MKIDKLAIPDVLKLTPNVIGDDRGFFMEVFRASVFEDMGYHFVQDNHSKSVKGTLRGLHFQVAPSAQTKLVRCTKGEIYDVAVDVRPSSPTFGQWVAEILSEENKHMLLVPGDFAHGFYVMSDIAEVQYKCTDYYNKGAERAVRWNDPSLNIDWPITTPPILSDKDKTATLLSDLQ